MRLPTQFLYYCSEILKSAQQALTEGTGTNRPANRMELESTLDAVIADIVPKYELNTFVQALYAVNSNLASHGNPDLPPEMQGNYPWYAEQVLRGRMANTTAHLYASAGWGRTAVRSGLEKGQVTPDYILGAIMNFGGAVGSGVIDRMNEKSSLVTELRRRMR